MKRYFLILTLAILCMPEVFAQYNYRMEGKCGLDVKWSFDGVTLVISNVNKKGCPWKWMTMISLKELPHGQRKS